MRLLFATDGSEDAGIAGDSLRRLRWGKDDHLVVLSVIPEYVLLTGRIDPDLHERHRWLRDAETRDAEAIVRQAADALEPLFGSVETRIHAGSPAHETLEAARDVRADLVVMGNRGRTVVGEWLLGSVAKAVLEGAPCSVLIGRAANDGASRVLLAYDGSPESKAALDWVMRLPLPPATHVEVVSVMQPISLPPVAIDLPQPAAYYEVIRNLEKRQSDMTGALLDRAIGRLRSNGVPADGHFRIGDAIHEIAAVASEKGIDLIIIGAHARHGWIPDLLGNTARGVFKATRCSVLVARSAAPPSPDRQAAVPSASRRRSAPPSSSEQPSSEQPSPEQPSPERPSPERPSPDDGAVAEARR